MRCLILFTLFYVVACTAIGQDLKKVKLTREERDKGIIEKYKAHSAAYHPQGFLLLLYANKTYRYEEAGMFQNNFFNTGIWTRTKTQLILQDHINKDNIPIKLEYLSKAGTANPFVFQIVKNLKGEELTDGFVFINNDSTSCLPMMGTCLKEYAKIDSIKFVFENGYRTKWMKLAHNNYAQILPVLQTNIKMYDYGSLRYSKYKIVRSSLKGQE
jgi:hypothetical protein